MFDTRLLEPLVLFSKLGTLSATADKLMITQPTVTRTMQRLEEELGLKLFERTANRLYLTESGHFVAEKAEELLAKQQLFLEVIKQHDSHQQRIPLSSTLPGPIHLLKDNKIDNLLIKEDLITPETVENELLDHQAMLVMTSEELFSSEIESLYLSDEQLYVHIDSKLLPNQTTSLTFSDLAHQRFITLKGLGIWESIVQKAIPDALFMTQENQASFSEIINQSNFSYFSTNLVKGKDKHDNRKQLRISDDIARQPIYVAYRLSDKDLLQPTLKKLRTLWAELG